MPTASATTMTPPSRQRPAPVGDEPVREDLEDRLRLRAFRVFYDKAFADELDLAIRFAKAIIASAGPILDRQAVLDWDRNHGRKRSRP